MSASESHTFAYLGPVGTFTEAALKKITCDSDVLIPFANVTAALNAVRTGDAQYALVPIENSVEGVVARHELVDRTVEQEAAAAERVGEMLVGRWATALKRPRMARPHAIMSGGWAPAAVAAHNLRLRWRPRRRARPIEALACEVAIRLPKRARYGAPHPPLPHAQQLHRRRVVTRPTRRAVSHRARPPLGSRGNPRRRGGGQRLRIARRGGQRLRIARRAAICWRK